MHNMYSSPYVNDKLLKRPKREKPYMQLKLLLLEDQEPDAAILLRVLSRSGMKCDHVRAANREEFINALQRDTFNVILADNHLPQFNATGALEILREMKITTPLILVTGTASEEFAVNMMKAGIADYILKDRLQRLPTAIISAINKHALEEKDKANINTLIRNAALLNESEQLAHLGSWEADQSTGTTIWSDENYRILGYEPGEIPAGLDAFLKCIHPDDLQYVKDIITDAKASLTSRRYNCRIITRNGELKYLENNINATKDEHTNAIRVNGFSIDVSHRRRAEAQLAMSEANLSTIFSNTDTGYGLLDTSFNILSFNQPMYRFSVEQMTMPLEVGKNVTAFFKPERRAIVTEVMKAARNGKTTEYEVCYPQGDGTDKWFKVNCHPATDSVGNVIGIVMSQRDITRKKTLELREKLMTEDLMIRNSVLEQFAYVVSHNLRGPMTTVLGIAGLMQDDDISDLSEADRRFFMRGIAESVQKLDSVILDLNSILQFRTGGYEQKQTVLFPEIVHEINAAISAPADNSALSIVTDFSAAERIFTLKSYIHSIFYNLVSNSVKFSRPGVAPVVEIASRKEGDKIVLTFKDNGLGMDLSRIGDQVFGMFKRFHYAAAEGKGMGLFMVKTQVDTLGGKITVNSEVNKGTEFTITFNA